jgi:Predicted hydrolases of the HAD superfamily
VTIKLVAFDMDGTFLNDKNTYNHQRFAKILEKDYVLKIFEW